MAPASFFGLLAIMKPSNRRFDRAGAELGIHLRPGEEVQVRLVGLRELLADEVADRHHAGLLADQRLRGLLPGAAVGVRLVERQQLGPLREHVP